MATIFYIKDIPHLDLTPIESRMVYVIARSYSLAYLPKTVKDAENAGLKWIITLLKKHGNKSDDYKEYVPELLTKLEAGLVLLKSAEKKIKGKVDTKA
jgi:hypothetical protein